MGKKFKGKQKSSFRPQGNHFHERKTFAAPEKPVMKPVEKRKVPAKIVSLSRNFAFARPDDGGEDMFIHADRLHGAFLGDSVVLTNIIQQEKGPSAEVEEITAEGSRFLTGTLRHDEYGTLFHADAALRYALALAKGSLTGLHDGDKVQVEVVPGSHGEYLGRVLKLYGRGDSARVCADAIIDENRIRREFPEEVKEEALRLKDRQILPEELKGRLDLRKTAICTIDSASAKDLDDAISVSRTRTGYKLGVHIADVSHYVKPGSAIDREAMERGTSVYFADRVIPMLPEELSNGVCSLNAGEDKLTFSALIWIDLDGNIEKYEFHKSVIHSKVRGVYSEVNEIFAGKASKELKEKYAPVQRSLSMARKLAALLRQKSKESGTVDLASSESVFTVDENGVCIDVNPHTTGESEQMIEQLMIMANRAAAMLAEKHQLPFVYRVHEKPNPDRVDSLAELVTALGFSAKPLEHRGDVKTGDLAAVMRQAEGTTSERVISHQILRTMAKARYDTAPIGHFGLALADYCHFTSPIRRYPDTSIHRILSFWLKTQNRGECVARFQTFAQESAAQSSDCEVRAMTAERSAEDCYMAEYMRAHLGEHFLGVISGVTMRGVFVQLPNTVEGFVPVESFPDAHFRFDGVVTQVDETTGRRLTIGQEFPVKAVAADVSSGRIDFMYDPEP